jgi:hypothetical protein
MSCILGSKHTKPSKPHKDRRFTTIEVQAMKRAYLAGVTMPELATEYGVSKDMVKQIIRGSTCYKEIGC